MPSMMDIFAVGSFLLGVPGAIMGVIQLHQWRKNQPAQPTFRQNHPKTFASFMTLMAVAIVVGSWALLKPKPVSDFHPSLPPSVAQQPTVPAPSDAQPQQKPPIRRPARHKKTIPDTGIKPTAPATAVATAPPTTTPVAPTTPAVNCPGRNTFTNVNIRAEHAVSLLSTSCNDFVGGSIVGGETGVTVSTPYDEQTGKPIGVPAPVVQQLAPASNPPR
jgi:hypothetical protein